MALDNKRSVYEIAIEIGGKLKQSLGTATSGANKKLSGLAVYADKTARATTSLSKALKGMMLVKGASWVGEHMIRIGKSAITAASEMETYRTTLNTVLRDEEKAADMMRWSTEFAAHTPYNTGDIVDAVTRLEAYGFKSQAMLENIGNMASAMNKDLPTAVEAVYKATLGEMELMENNFAITKKLINEKAQEWYGKAVIDASKKITDTEMYTNTLLRLIEEKFEGGMEAQSRTWAGIKSNMEDSRDAIFRRIVGMDAAGEATENGLYARMLRMGQTAADYLSELADSEALDTFADKIGHFLDTDGARFATWAKEQADISVDTITNLGWIGEIIGRTWKGAGEDIQNALTGINAIANWASEHIQLLGGGSMEDAWKSYGYLGKWADDSATGFETRKKTWEKWFGEGSYAEEAFSFEKAVGPGGWDYITEYIRTNGKVKSEQQVRSEYAASVSPIQLFATPRATGTEKTSFEITVHASGSETMAREIADAVAKRVEAVETAKEAAHYNARVSLRPNKMQTAY